MNKILSFLSFPFFSEEHGTGYRNISNYSMKAMIGAYASFPSIMVPWFSFKLIVYTCNKGRRHVPGWEASLGNQKLGILGSFQWCNYLISETQFLYYYLWGNILPPTIILFRENSHYTWGFPDGSASKESTWNEGDTGDMGSISGSGRSLEREMSIHSSIVAWEIPWIEEPGGLQSLGCKV